jgi:ferredoxin
MLRKIRITAAIICFAFITLLFVDVTGVLHHWFGWLAKIQFIPALLAVNVVVVLLLLLLTLALGRIYCSVICPLGVFQDIVSWVAAKRKKFRYSYSSQLKILRYVVLAVFVLAFALGVNVLVALLEPYSAYGRMASNLFAPVYQWGNNALAYLAERSDSYMFYSVDVWLKSIATLVVAVVTFVAVAFLAWRNGRTYCNTICPVGTILGFLSQYSLFKPVIDTQKCNACGLCARNCKSSCINSKEHQIDYSRCVTCFDCVSTCRQSAITYQYVPYKKASKIKVETPQTTNDEGGNSRRNFLSMTALLAVASIAKAQQEKVDNGLAILKEKKVPKRLTALTPAGSHSAHNMEQHCTACQLCISECPNQVLRPSTGLKTLMQPEMSYERGYCRPECVRCSEVCPTGAIDKITTADKSAIQIGHAVWLRDNCVVNTDKVSCGNCARHCPAAAIQMVALNPSDAQSLKIPVVNTERCIGCGACENLCPARPFSAIYVEGHERHRTI